jgi:hypothetical protein
LLEVLLCLLVLMALLWIRLQAHLIEMIDPTRPLLVRV